MHKVAVFALALGGILTQAHRPLAPTPATTDGAPERATARGLRVGDEPTAANAGTRAQADEPPAGLSREEWAQIRGLVAKGQYHAASVTGPGEPTVLKASNPRQGYVTTFRPEGIELASRPVVGNDWRLAVRVTGFGYEGEVLPLPAAEPIADKQRVEYRRGPVTEWYENRPEGLEQGFTIAEPPGHRADVLVVALAVTGDGEVALEGDDARFTDASGRTLLRYTGLETRDASGKALPTRMEGGGRELRLLVEAGSARFPATVDPTFVQEQKLVASDGAAYDDFGKSVSVSGNTAVVGAYGDDVGANAEGSAYVFVRSGGVWSQQQKLVASDGAASDYFGKSVSVSGDTAVVGAYLDDVGANLDQGSAYVFVRSGGVWSQQQKLMASDGATSDYLGTSVSLSGDTAVVGAYGDDVGANANQGSAYVFVRSGGVWSQQQKLVAPDGATSDYFGASASASGDTAVVGAYGDDVGANANQGSAYVFVRSGGVWSQQQKLGAADGAADDVFGYSVSVSGDTAAVGAYGDDIGASANQGSAYVFVRSGGVWSEQQKLVASDGAAGDAFGYSVSVSGDTAVVGAFQDAVGVNGYQGSAYVFVRNAGWSEQQKLLAFDGAASDQFGYSVSVSGDTAVAGATFDDVAANGDQGSAYMFVRSAGVWSEQQNVVGSDGADDDWFGVSVSVSADTAVVGAYGDDVGANFGQGSAYVFVRSGEVWNEQQKLVASDGTAWDGFGYSVSVSGDTAVVGAYGDQVGANLEQGSAYVFVRSGGVWNERQKLVASDGAAYDQFGCSVSVSGDTTVVGAHTDDVGAIDQGSAYVFVRNGGVWSGQQKLVASDGAVDDRFGRSVSVHGDTTVVGAAWDDAGANGYQGSAYVFVRNGGVWSEQQKLVASDGTAYDQFGYSVSVSGDATVVGAYGDDVGANEAQGSAYVFVRSGGVWSQQQHLVASDGAAYDQFGYSVSVSGDTAVVGAAWGEVGANANQGAAYVFVRSGGVWSQQPTLVASDGAALDQFGYSVSVFGGTAVVGAVYDDVGAYADQGSAYVFVADLIFKDGFQ